MMKIELWEAQLKGSSIESSKDIIGGGHCKFCKKILLSGKSKLLFELDVSVLFRKVVCLS
jgi:hypothetical protein